MVAAPGTAIWSVPGCAECVHGVVTVTSIFESPTKHEDEFDAKKGRRSRGGLTQLSVSVVRFEVRSVLGLPRNPENDYNQDQVVLHLDGFK